MNSLTMIAHGVASGRRHGRSRACPAYQFRIRRTTARALPIGSWRSWRPLDRAPPSRINGSLRIARSRTRGDVPERHFRAHRDRLTDGDGHGDRRRKPEGH